MTDEIPYGISSEPQASRPAYGGASKHLASKRVVLGVTGSIAAYKAATLCRLLVDAGVHVSPVMTADAGRFLGPATLSALASEPVRDSLWSGPEPIPHTALGRAADLVLVAPATAALLAKYVAGIADDLLTATLLATRAPVVVCPAMHAEMWEHPATVDNVERLRARGVLVVEPGTGRLAGGDEGAGRLAEPQEILAEVERLLSPRDLAGRTVLITAGGTREPLDPVRFLGNRSSGKQGEALAAEAWARGAAVTLVTTAESPALAGVGLLRVETAAEMETAVLTRGEDADVVIMAAAVADFRPRTMAEKKLRKREGVPEVVLEPTTDILAELGRRKRRGQVLVGFAAETGDATAGAGEKLRDKQLDLVVANDVTVAGAGFGHDTNAAVLLDAAGKRTDVPLTTKRELATIVLDVVAGLLPARAGGPAPGGQGLADDAGGSP